MQEETISTITVTALQFAPELGAVSKNIASIKELISKVTFNLLVLPELASTGYFFTRLDELLQLAESPENGDFCGWVRELAQEKEGVVVAGFAERSGEALYNSALIALPDGTWYVYRKTHLFYKESLVFQPGDSGFFVVEWDGVRFGTMICYDWRFPESARTLALRGADIIAHPSNLVAAKGIWGPTMQTRAFENKVITVTANRYGAESRNGETLEFSGRSQVTDMNGRVLAEATPVGDCVVTAQANPFATRNKAFNSMNNIMTDRRPEYYG